MSPPPSSDARPAWGAGITRYLETASPTVFSAYAIVAAFTTYFCMYAFRKPYGAATYEGFEPVDLPGLPPLDYKIVLVIAQVLGYTLSKFTGIKVISEMAPARRAVALLGFIGFAHGALLLFAILPAPYNILAMFLNGLPLGMIWGLTFGFLEGRRTSEALGAGLSASYIIASGYVKWAGKELLAAGVPTVWMPFATGLFFLPILVLAVFLLSRMPPPSPEDEAARTKREPMDAAARWAFLRAFAPGLIPLTLLYVALTAFRDFRDNFAAELWKALGYGSAPTVFATSENWVAFGVMVALGLLMVIKDNRVGLMAVHAVMMAGTALMGGATLLYQSGAVDGYWWMVLVGVGAYLAYVPYGCVLFDRLIAAVGVTATAGFMIYVTDACGYLGSVALMLYRDLGAPDLSWLDFFVAFTYATSIGCTALYAVSMLYFWRTTAAHAAAQAEGV